MITFNTEAYIENQNQACYPKFSYQNALDSGDWQSWQEAFREQLSEISGLTAIKRQFKDLPLSPDIVEVKDFEFYTREKGYILAEPGVQIPFYLLLPKGEGPFPLVLTPHGHGKRGKEVHVGNFADEQEREESLARDRDVAIQAVSEGYAVIAMDVRGFYEMAREEERSKDHLCSCRDLQKKSIMYGRTLIGERVHDMGRLIDYAATRPEIRTDEIVITGNSGGGTVSLFTAALDKRITIAIPGSYFCTFADSIVSIVHCTCNIIPGIMKFGEMYDVAGLIAPRPVLFVSGERDPLFPSDATRNAFAHVQRIYAAMGHPDNCELYIGDGDHRYFKKPVWPFVKRHLSY